MNILKDLK